SGRTMMAQAGPSRKDSKASAPMLVASKAMDEHDGLVIDYNLAGCYSLPSGAVAWWMAESNAQDSIGLTNGTSYNGVTYTNGEVVTAFNLNGSNQHIRAANQASLQLTNAMTLEAWVYPTSLGGYMNVAVKWDATAINPPQNSYTLAVDPNGYA